MTQTVEVRRSAPQPLELTPAAALPCDEVLSVLGSSSHSFSSGEAGRRLAEAGPNALRSHGVRAVAVFVSQLRSPFLILLLVTAVASVFLGERTDALIIFLISGLSVGLGFVSEYRSARAVAALHSQLRHTAIVLRDGRDAAVDVTALVPGDVVRLGVGDVGRASLRGVAPPPGVSCVGALVGSRVSDQRGSSGAIRGSRMAAMPDTVRLEMSVEIRTGDRASRKAQSK